MKLLGFACLAGTGFAGLAEMGKIFAARNQTRPMSRGIPGELTSEDYVVKQIDGSGCWCYFDVNFGKGKSTPLNIIDEACKVFHDAYECAMLDVQDCVPWQVEYNPPTGYTGQSSGDLSNFIHLCEDSNEDECAKRACEIEYTFVDTLESVMSSNDGFAAFLEMRRGGVLNHAHEDFKLEEKCITKTGTASERECCGTTHTTRFPYRTLGGERKCCGDKTYNSVYQDCCSDQLVDPGTDCASTP